MNRDSVIRGLEAISRCMDDNREMLIELDSRNDDIRACSVFSGVCFLI